MMDVFVQNAGKLAPLGSSQPNEALNNTVGSKAPKIRHYGSSESNDYRVACAVGQKNLGHSFVAGGESFGVPQRPCNKLFFYWLTNQ